jgi:hypothetical protein
MNWEALKLEASGHIHQALGEPIRYHYVNGNTVNTSAVFTMADVLVSDGGQVPIDSREPMCNLRRCNMERKPRQGDTLTRRNVTYEIKQVKEALDASWDCLLLVIDSRYANAARDKT